MFGISPSVPLTVPKVHTPARRRLRRRQFRYGKRAAAIRAFTAARIYLSKMIPTLATLAAVAEACGTNVAYVRAAIILLKADNTSLISDVLRGRVPLLAAAAEAKRLVNLVAAYKAAKDPDRVAFARACGTEAILNVLVAAGN